MAKQPDLIEPKPKGTIVDDLELVAMQRISKCLQSLPDDVTRKRVLDWFVAKANAQIKAVPPGEQA